MNRVHTRNHLLLRLSLMVTLLAAVFGCAPNAPAGETPEAGNTPAAVTPSRTKTPASHATVTPNLPPIGDDEHAVVTFAISRWEKSFYQPLADEFNAQNPNITVLLVETDDLFQDPENTSYQRVLASAADVSMVWPSTDEDLGFLYRDLQPLIDADATFDAADFWPGLFFGCQDLEGRTFGVPTFTNVGGIFYNKQAFDEAGLPYPQPGWTFEEFQSTVQALARKDGGEIRYGMADLYSLHNSVLAPLVDGLLVDANGELDAAALTEAVQWYVDLAMADAIFPLVAFEDNDSEGWDKYWQELDKLFQSENRPVMWAGRITDSIPNSMGGMYDPEDPLSGMAIKTEGFAPFPVDPDNFFNNTSPAWTQCLGISAGSRQPRAAWAWINFLSHKWLVMDQEQGWALSQTPARRSVADAVGYWDRLPASIRPSLTFALEHIWSYSPYMLEFEMVNQAFGRAMATPENFAQVFSDELAERQANLLATPKPTPNTTPVVVSTPKPTPDIAAGAVRLKYFTTMFSLEEEEKLNAVIAAYNKENPDIYVELSTDWDLGGEQIDDWNAYLADNYDCYNWYPPSWQSETPETQLGLNALLQNEGSDFINDYIPSQLDIYRYEGEVYGLPYVSDPQIIGYNADLLAERGLKPPDADWTFEDLVALSMAAAGDSPDGPVYGFLTSEWDDTAFSARGVNWADLKSDPPVALFDSPEMIETLTWLVEMKTSGAFLIQGDNNWEESALAVGEGRVAFWSANASQPEGWYSMTGEPPTYRVGVAPMPRASEDGHIPVYGSERGFFISNQTENAQACWNWIKYLSLEIGVATGVPARLSLLTSPEWEAAVGPDNALMYRTAVERIDREIYTEEYNPISWPFYTWRSDAIRAALNGEDPQKALQAAQQKADGYLMCMTGFNLETMTDEQLNEQANTCAKQVDPNGPWGGGMGNAVKISSP